MVKISNGGPFGPTLKRQIKRLAEEYALEQGREYARRYDMPATWEARVMAWVHFAIDNPALELSFGEWEEIHRASRRPVGLRLMRRP